MNIFFMQDSNPRVKLIEKIKKDIIFNLKKKGLRYSKINLSLVDGINLKLEVRIQN